jgi:ABC-type nitrate/sulfonate/bicarbonate transport system permease component
MSNFARVAYPTLGVVIFFGVWALITGFALIDTQTLPAPWDVIAAMVRYEDVLLPELWFTLQEILLATAITLSVGILIGLIIVDCAPVGRILYPLLVSTQVIPKIAVGPILLVWLGFGQSSKVAIAFLIAFFPVVLGTVLGLQSISTEKWELVRTMGASWWKVLIKLRIPSALPFLMSGIKLAVVYCVTGAVIGELVGADHGIGRAVLQASAAYKTDAVFAATGYVVLLGIAAFFLLSLIEAAVLRSRGRAAR